MQGQDLLHFLGPVAIANGKIMLLHAPYEMTDGQIMRWKMRSRELDRGDRGNREKKEKGWGMN